jgi:glycosyltransferase involved in cell wall biosynthesis
MTKPRNQLKVIHVASGDRWAGAEAQVYTMLKTLKKMDDITVYAVILNDGELAKKLDTEGINTTILDETTLSSWQILLRLRTLFQEIQPNIIHTHRLKENILACIANKLSTNAILVATIHGDSEFHFSIWKIHKHAPQWINWFCTRFLYKKLIAVSKDLGKKLSNSYPENRIQVIENGIDIEAVQLAANSSYFETDRGIKHHIGIAGRLEQVKRVDIFLDMVRILIEGSPENEWHFHVFGDGSLESKLKEQTKLNGIAKNVTFHGHRQDIAGCLQAMDCLVMCSDHEGLPMTPLEALALKTPVIAHETGGLVDILKGSTADLLVSNHSPEGYAAIVSNLFSPNVVIEKHQNSGHIKITEDFTAKSNAQKCHNMYLQLVNKWSLPL